MSANCLLSFRLSCSSYFLALLGFLLRRDFHKSEVHLLEVALGVEVYLEVFPASSA